MRMSLIDVFGLVIWSDSIGCHLLRINYFDTGSELANVPVECEITSFSRRLKPKITS